MNITTYIQHDFVDPADLAGKQTVVIDTFRATTTMTTALKNGAKRMVTVMHVQDAFDLQKQDSTRLLGGERNTKKIAGFDFGNSPLEYTRQAVQGREVVMSTTNGTKAATAAAQSDRILLGCFGNVAAVAEYLTQQNLDIVLLCAGTVGKLSMEDFLTAGAIVDALPKECALCDTSIAARDLYRLHKNDLNGVLCHTKHYNTMLQNGLKDDIDFCMQVNTCDTVPIFDGIGFVNSKRGE